ncbi:MAG: tetratricopeptide repeat protein [Calditrichia bacterium]|nr:tetratricopeptide repeat protein [Calditrichia bacterium]
MIENKIKNYIVVFLFFVLMYSISNAQNRRVLGIISFGNENDQDKYGWVSRGVEEILYDKLKNMSGYLIYEKETLDRYLSHMGIQNSLQVKAREAYKIGKFTGIEVLILGSYKVVSGNKLSIHVEFLNTYTGSKIYEQTYVADLSQIFNIFERVVISLNDVTQIEASPKEHAYLKKPITKSIKAFQYYCQAYQELEKKGTRMEVAAGLFSRSLREDPDFWEAQYNMGVIYYSYNFLDRAEQQFNKVINKNPRFFKPFYGRGVIYYVKREYKKAKNDFNHVLDIREDHDRSLYYLGSIESAQGNLNKAITILQKSININPDYAPAHFQLGVCFKKQRRYKTSIKILRQALNLYTGIPEAHNVLGECYYRVNMFDEALTAFNKAIELKYDYANAYFNKANTIYKKNSLQEIVAAYMDLLESFFGENGNGNSNESSDRGLTSEADRNKPLSAQAQKVYHDMILAYKKAILYDPSFFESAFNLGITFDNLNKVDSAFYFYKLALDIEPSLARAHMRIAKIYEENEDFPSALQEYKEVVKWDISFFSISPKLGEEYRYINVVDETIKEVNDQIKQNPNDVGALMSMGRIYFGLKKYTQAKQLFTKVIQLDPKQKSAKRYLNRLKQM